MKIVILDGSTLNPGDNPWDPLRKLGEIEIYERTPPEQVVARSQGADVLVVNKVRLPEAVIDALPDLKFIAVTATGYDVVDVAAAGHRGIPVANVPIYGTDSVAQLVFALLLELCHHVGLHDRAVQEGQWAKSENFCFWLTPLMELAGKTMGIVGHGRIGQRVGQIAHAFGMAVLAHDEFPQAAPDYAPFAWAGLDELFERSDVVTFHCNLTPRNKGLVRRELLSRMKPGAFLINTARGPLVVEEDLAEALNSGRLGGTAVDVVSAEPIKPDNPLLGARNCVITPHIAWATLAARRRLMDTTAANVESFMAGRPGNIVNSEALAAAGRSPAPNPTEKGKPS